MRSLLGVRQRTRPNHRSRRLIGASVTVLAQTGRDLWANHVMEWAAAIAFYALLSFLPLLLAATAAAAYLVDPAWAAGWFTTLIGAVLPPDFIDTEPIVTMALADQGKVGIIGIVAWLFGGRRILGALITALDLVSDVDVREETFQRRFLVEMALLIALGALFVLTLMVGPRVVPPGTAVSSVLGALLLALGFAVLYSVVPLGARGKRAVLIGAGAATLLFIVARLLFVASVEWVWASVSLIYGPLAVAVVLLLWGWYAGLVVLFGGSLASHVKVMIDEGRSAEEARQRHVAETGVE